MGNSFRKAPVHPLEPRRTEAPASFSLAGCGSGSYRIKVRMPAKEYKDLVSGTNGNNEIGELILQGCLKGRWEAVLVSRLEVGNEHRKGGCALESIDEDGKLKLL